MEKKLWDKEKSDFVDYESVINENVVPKVMQRTSYGKIPVFSEKCDNSFVEDIKRTRWGSANYDRKTADLVIALQKAGFYNVIAESGHCYDCKTYYKNEDAKKIALKIYCKPLEKRLEHGYIDFNSFEPEIENYLKQKKIQNWKKEFSLNNTTDDFSLICWANIEKQTQIHFYYSRNPEMQDKTINDLKNLLSLFYKPLEILDFKT